jgi:hypothetical protein
VGVGSSHSRSDGPKKRTSKCKIRWRWDRVFECAVPCFPVFPVFPTNCLRASNAIRVCDSPSNPG